MLPSAHPLTHKHSPSSPLPHSQGLSSALTFILCSAQPAPCLASSALGLLSVPLTVLVIAVALILDLLTVLGTQLGLTPTRQAF